MNDQLAQARAMRLRLPRLRKIRDNSAFSSGASGSQSVQARTFRRTKRSRRVSGWASRGFPRQRRQQLRRYIFSAAPPADGCGLDCPVVLLAVCERFWALRRLPDHPSILLVGDFSHFVERATVHQAKCFEAQSRTEAQSRLRPGLKKMKAPENGFLKEAVKLAGRRLHGSNRMGRGRASVRGDAAQPGARTKRRRGRAYA